MKKGLPYLYRKMLSRVKSRFDFTSSFNYQEKACKK